MLNRKLVQKLNAQCSCPNPDPTDHMADGHLGACLREVDAKVVHNDGFHQVRRPNVVLTSILHHSDVNLHRSNIVITSFCVVLKSLCRFNIVLTSFLCLSQRRISPGDVLRCFVSMKLFSVLNFIKDTRAILGVPFKPQLLLPYPPWV